MPRAPQTPQLPNETPMYIGPAQTPIVEMKRSPPKDVLTVVSIVTWQAVGMDPVVSESRYDIEIPSAAEYTAPTLKRIVLPPGGSHTFQCGPGERYMLSFVNLGACRLVVGGTAELVPNPPGSRIAGHQLLQIADVVVHNPTDTEGTIRALQIPLPRE